MSFTVKIADKTEKISILLCSDRENNNKIRVELDGENQKKFDELKDKSSLGKNCFLGGKSVIEAIQDKEFTKHQSYKPATLSTFLERLSISNVFSSLKDKFQDEAHKCVQLRKELAEYEVIVDRAVENSKERK